MAFLYKGTDDWSGVKWCVRTVYWHDSYGLNDMLTYGGDYNPYEKPENPLIKFYQIQQKKHDSVLSDLVNHVGIFLQKTCQIVMISRLFSGLELCKSAHFVALIRF